MEKWKKGRRNALIVDGSFEMSSRVRDYGVSKQFFLNWLYHFTRTPFGRVFFPLYPGFWTKPCPKCGARFPKLRTTFLAPEDKDSCVFVCSKCEWEPKSSGLCQNEKLGEELALYNWNNRIQLIG